MGPGTSPTTKMVLGNRQGKHHEEKGFWEPPGKMSVTKDILNNENGFW